jgi:hypothetical protein
MSLQDLQDWTGNPAAHTLEELQEISVPPPSAQIACISRFSHAFYYGEAPETETLTLADLLDENEGNEHYLAELVGDLLDLGSFENSDHKSVLVYTLLDRDELESRWAAYQRTLTETTVAS